MQKTILIFFYFLHCIVSFTAKPRKANKFKTLYPYLCYTIIGLKIIIFNLIKFNKNEKVLIKTYLLKYNFYYKAFFFRAQSLQSYVQNKHRCDPIFILLIFIVSNLLFISHFCHYLFYCRILDSELFLYHYKFLKNLINIFVIIYFFDHI